VFQELEAQGRINSIRWTRQFTIEAGRADEYVELYESLGDEVRVELVTPELMAALRPAQDMAEECTICLLADCDKYVVIYTRPLDLARDEAQRV